MKSKFPVLNVYKKKTKKSSVVTQLLYGDTFKKIEQKNEISINTSKHIVLINNRKINLTKTQFEILKLLFNQHDVVFSREQIMEKIWGTNYYIIPRNVDVQIRKIRKAIGQKKIITIKGVGYKFSSE